jgi:hypothetical protein
VEIFGELPAGGRAAEDPEVSAHHQLAAGCARSHRPVRPGMAVTNGAGNPVRAQHAYGLVERGDLENVKIGRRSFITANSLRTFVKRLTED